MSESPSPPPPPSTSPNPKTRFSKLSPGIPKRFPESPKGRLVNNSQFSRKGSKAPTPNRSRSPGRDDSKGKMPFRSLAASRKDPNSDSRKSPSVPKSPVNGGGMRSMFNRSPAKPKMSKSAPISKRSSSAPTTRIKSSLKSKQDAENKSSSSLATKSAGTVTNIRSGERLPPKSGLKQDNSEDLLVPRKNPSSQLQIDLGVVFSSELDDEDYRGTLAYESQPSSEASLSLLMHCQPSLKEKGYEEEDHDELGIAPSILPEPRMAVLSPSSSRPRSSAEILSLLNNIPTSPSSETQEPLSSPPAVAAQVNLPEAYLQHLSCVVPGVFIGDIEAAVSADMLTAAGVTHLVDLSNSFVDENTELAKSRPIKNVHYEVSKVDGGWASELSMLNSKLVVRVDDVDGAPLAEHFDAINKYISSALSEGGSVLVHCFRGKSRSATAVVQYLMQVEKMNLKEAMARTRSARPCIDINVTFRKALMELERNLRPDEEPSIKLRLTSRKPVLSSANRARSKSAPKRVGMSVVKKKVREVQKLSEESEVALNHPAPIPEENENPPTVIEVANGAEEAATEKHA